MKLEYTALTIAQLEDDLGCKLIDLFGSEEAVANTVLSTKIMLALVSAGYGNDYQKGNEAFMTELKKRPDLYYGDIFEKVMEGLQRENFLPRASEEQVQKLNHGKKLSEKVKVSKSNGNKAK